MFLKSKTVFIHFQHISITVLIIMNRDKMIVNYTQDWKSFALCVC